MERILAIPLIYGMVDSLVWHFDSKGSFSVKSAYHSYQIKKNF